MLSYDKQLKTFSQHLRKNMTDAEKMKGTKLKGTLIQIQLCIAKEKILTAARQRGYRVKQKLTLPNGRSRIHLDAKITERFMT